MDMQNRGDSQIKRKNILLVKVTSRYGSFGRYIDQMAEAMRKLGCNICVLDACNSAVMARYCHITSIFRFDAVIDIDGMLAGLGMIKHLPGETIYGTYFCDPPKPWEKGLLASDERTIVFSCDKDFRDYIRRFYPNIKYVEFIPLSGNAYPQNTPYESRAIDIIFTGSYEEEPEKIREGILARFQGGALAGFVEDMCDDIIARPQQTLAVCLLAALEKHKLKVSDREFDELMGEFMRIHYYARMYFRDRLIRVLLAAGLKIHVYGMGWSMFRSEHKENLIVHQGGIYAASKALADAKISLNIMPWFKDGFQERIASAMLSRAVAVTDESKFINDNFADGRDLIIYSLKDMDGLAERIKYLLANPKEAKEIAERGYRKIQEHTWYNRTRDMLQKMEKKFGISFIQEGEGTEIQAGYPDQQSAVLDAICELKEMADFIDNDMDRMEKISGLELKYIRDRFCRFWRRSADVFKGMEVHPYVWECMQDSGEDIPKYKIELFSMQCRSLLSELLLEVSGDSLGL